MEWEIISFKGAGSILFGMSADEVSAILGALVKTRKGLYPQSFSERRKTGNPIISYTNGIVTEIEFFYEVENLSFDGILLFKEGGKSVLRKLQEKNGGSLISAGTILFKNIGISAGRLDQSVREDHSVTAFARNFWDNDLENFKKIKF